MEEEPLPDPNQPEIMEEAPAIEQESGEAAEEDNDDRTICRLNLQMAIHVLGIEQKLVEQKESDTDMDEVLNKLRRARTRLGDLHMVEERFKDCIDEYRKVIEQEYPRGGKSNRLVATLHFMTGNAILYQEEPNESEAIQEYVLAI